MAYGPPTFGEHPQTDHKETFFSLTLDQSLCVLQGDTLEDEGEGEVRQVQLVFLDEKFPPESVRGHHVFVTGTLFHQNTAHHHTKVLMTVKSVGTTPP